MAQQICATFPCITEKDAKRAYLWLEPNSFLKRTRWWKLLYIFLRYGSNGRLRRSFGLAVLTAEADEIFILIQQKKALNLPDEKAERALIVFAKKIQEKSWDKSKFQWKDALFSIYAKWRLDNEFKVINNGRRRIAR